MIIELNYRIEKKFSGKQNRYRMRSLLQCEICNNVREVYKEHITRGNQDTKYCSRCFQKSPETRAKMSERKIGKNHWIWQKDRQTLEVNRKLSNHIRKYLHNLLNFKYKNTKELESILGYTLNDLKNRIESTWEPWMNWNNYGNCQQPNTWCIDHIKSISEFLYEGIDDPKIVNALTNLRALNSIENCKKGDLNSKGVRIKHLRTCN